jgi:hypothetical protein
MVSRGRREKGGKKEQRDRERREGRGSLSHIPSLIVCVKSMTFFCGTMKAQTDVVDLWTKPLFKDESTVDVFLVGSQKTAVPAHRLVLAASSKTFSINFFQGWPLLPEAMFIDASFFLHALSETLNLVFTKSCSEHKEQHEVMIYFLKVRTGYLNPTKFRYLTSRPRS